MEADLYSDRNNFLGLHSCKRLNKQKILSLDFMHKSFLLFEVENEIFFHIMDILNKSLLL